MPSRISYAVTINVNGRLLSRVVIDQHYKNKHGDTINDLLILKLVKMINGRSYEIEKQVDNFQYFTIEPLIFSNKPYRLVITICIGDDFLGVVNAFRINKREHE
jgi:hypothetical protein